MHHWLCIFCIASKISICYFHSNWDAQEWIIMVHGSMSAVFEEFFCFITEDDNSDNPLSWYHLFKKKSVLVSWIETIKSFYQHRELCTIPFICVILLMGTCLWRKTTNIFVFYSYNLLRRFQCLNHKRYMFQRHNSTANTHTVNTFLFHIIFFCASNHGSLVRFWPCFFFLQMKRVLLNSRQRIEEWKNKWCTAKND